MEQTSATTKNNSAVWGMVGAIAATAVVLILPNPEGLPAEGQRLAALLAGILVLWATEALPIAVTALLAVIFQPIFRVKHARRGFRQLHQPRFLLRVSDVSDLPGMAQDRPRAQIRSLDDFESGHGFEACALCIRHRQWRNFDDHVGRSQRGCIHGNRARHLRKIGTETGIAVCQIHHAGNSDRRIDWGHRHSGRQFDQYPGSRNESNRMEAPAYPSFPGWRSGIPMALLLLPFAAWILGKFFPPEIASIGTQEEIEKECRQLGPISPNEWKVVAIVGTLMVLWILSTWVPALDVTLVAMCGGCAMFLPGIRLFSWQGGSRRSGLGHPGHVRRCNHTGRSVIGQWPGPMARRFGSRRKFRTSERSGF